MADNLEHTVQIVDSEYKRLYPWALKEFDDAGEAVGPDFIPWHRPASFTGVQLTTKTQHRVEDGDEPAARKSSTTESLHGRLFPGSGFDTYHYGPVYKLFGTDRHAQDFDLYIVCLDSNDLDEYCWLYAIPSWSDGPHRYPDSLSIQIHLKPENFDRLMQAVQSQQVTHVSLNLKSVKGFYERDSEMRQRLVKILHSSNLVENPLGIDVEPEATGHGTDMVSEFELTWHSRSDLQMLASPNISDEELETRLGVEPDDNVEDTDDWEEPVEQPTPVVDSPQLLAQLQRNEAVLGRLMTPLWLLVILVAVGFFY